MARIGILPLARPTFDVGFAEANLRAAVADLARAGHDLVGARALLFDGPATEAAVAELAAARLDLVLVLQVTFTDASMATMIAETLRPPLAIWAFPEPRTGGRLRLNAFCGLNLAAHALGRRGHAFAWLYQAPGCLGVAAAIDDILAGGRRSAPPESVAPATADEGAGRALVEALRGSRIGRIGEHPVGFDTCDYDDARLAALAAVSVTPIPLGDLFVAAEDRDAGTVETLRRDAGRVAAGLDEVDAAALDRSLRLKAGLEALRAAGRFDAFAVRCWPEAFTEYGAAVCAPVSMMGEERVPCACEADVYGALTALVLQRVADAPVFLVDLVDVDRCDDTAVVWHCGQAPLSMADPCATPRATIHTNRRIPLLFEFPLKPGRVTVARLSQARGEAKMVVGGGEMLRRPMAFTGTSGVVRFDTPAPQLVERVIGGGLEHHLAVAYGDHRRALASVASALRLPVLEL